MTKRSKKKKRKNGWEREKETGKCFFSLVWTLCETTKGEENYSIRFHMNWHRGFVIQQRKRRRCMNLHYTWWS